METFQADFNGDWDFSEPQAKRARLDYQYGDMFTAVTSASFDLQQEIILDPFNFSFDSGITSSWRDPFDNPSHDLTYSTLQQDGYSFQTSNNSFYVAEEHQHNHFPQFDIGIQVQDVNSNLAESLPTMEVEIPEPHLPFPNEVCYGMITDVPITTRNSHNLDTSDIQLFFLAPDQLWQKDRDVQFGELDERVANIMVKLSTEQDISFQISCRTISQRAARKKKGSRKVGTNELQYVMKAIIYGPKDLGNSVGKFLTQCKVFLQDPTNCDKVVPYCNPHLISFNDEVIMTDSPELIKLQADIGDLKLTQELFSELTSDAHLSLTDAPDAIKTPLYKHQKKALTFMVQREQGWAFDGSGDDLWEKTFDETGQIKYTNLITEMSQKAVPEEAKGGLLADQMGLGKSLTMISLIALNTCKKREPFIFMRDGGSLRRLKSTLIVVPYSLLETWESQLKRHLRPNTLSWTRFHGSQKRQMLSLGGYDIAITTFETLVREQKRLTNPKFIGKDTLYSFFWHRIVLDEAHTIRNRQTAMARAACAIHATSRWAITGTPIQNRGSDFASLVEFLKIHPFSNPKVFDTEIAKPWLREKDKDTSRLKKLVKCISLCRTKEIIELPARRDETIKLVFGEEERKFYNEAKDRTRRRFDEALSSNPVKPGEYLNALQQLNELRLICNHGLIHSKRHVAARRQDSNGAEGAQVWNKTVANKAFETLICDGEARCSVCDNALINGVSGSDPDIPKPYLTKCFTLTCGSCIKDTPNGEPVPKCCCIPACKSVEVSFPQDILANVDGVQQKSLPEIPPEQVSTKLKRLLSDLKCCPDGEKSVVFSYWTYTLDLIQSLFDRESISYTRIDGQHSGEKRDQAIQEFQTDPSIQVILVSITCGGAGLDLTAASVAYLMEPQWNPMMEEQALCRIHRLGQEKEVKTIRYQIQDSFEQNVIATQELKRNIAAEAFEIRRNLMDATKRLEHLRTQLG